MLCVGDPADIIRTFESKLKETNLHVRQLKYNLKDLTTYIDSLGDICALVYCRLFRLHP